MVVVHLAGAACPRGALCWCCSRPMMLCKPHYALLFRLQLLPLHPPSFFHDLPFVCCLSLGRIQAAPCWLASLSELLMGCLPEHMIIGWYIPANTILSCFRAVVSLQSKNNKKWRNRGKKAQKRDLPTFVAALARFMPFSTHFIMRRISKFWRELPNVVSMSHMTNYIWL